MQERSVRTRQRIIIATARAINDRSYDRSSLGHIAADAGVTTGAFYFHFRSKEEAALAVMRVQDTYSQARALEISVRDSPALELMLETSSAIMLDIVQDPITCAGMRLASEIGLLDTFPTQIWQRWIDNTIEQLTTAVDEGTLHPHADTSELAELIVSSVMGIILRCSLKRDLASLPHRVHVMWQQFIQVHATDPQRWLSLAEKLFEVPTPEPLALEEIQRRHRENIASDNEDTEEKIPAEKPTPAEE